VNFLKCYTIVIIRIHDINKELHDINKELHDINKELHDINKVIWNRFYLILI